MWAPVQSKTISCAVYSSKQLENLEYITEQSTDDFDHLQEFCENSSFYKESIGSDFKFDPTRDRFADVLPLPKKTAIRLKTYGFDSKQPTEGSHFMNANVVHGHTFRYICSQAPKLSMIADFWKMVSEQNVLLMVMLCDDKGDVNHYWPTKSSPAQEDEYRKHGIYRIKRKENNNYKMAFDKYDLEVELKKTIRINKNFNPTELQKSEPGIIIRSIVLRNLESMKERTIAHIQYKNWPDKGIPNHNLYAEYKYLYETMYKYLYVVNKSQKITVLIHCRAGIGRTGTFVAIDQLIHKISLQLTNYSKGNSIDVFNTVLGLRMQRKGMVENKEQYLFIHKFIRYLMMNNYVDEFPIKYTRGQLSLGSIAELDSSDESEDESSSE